MLVPMALHVSLPVNKCVAMSLRLSETSKMYHVEVWVAAKIELVVFAPSAAVMADLFVILKGMCGYLQGGCRWQIVVPVLYRCVVHIWRRRSRVRCT